LRLADSRKCVFLAALVCALLFMGPLSRLVDTPEAMAAQAPRGAAYCGRANLDDSVTLVAFAHRVSCRYALRFAHRCLRGPSLHGWAFGGERGYTGLFKLTRGNAVIWLEDAGGTASCLNR
jgi:hypothetical protein